MRILILTQYYPPEIGAAQNRLYGLAIFLNGVGHTVTVLTALPNYPTGVIYDGYKNRLVVKEIRDGLTIVRTWLYTRQNLQFVGRLIHYVSFSALALIASIFKVGRQDIVITECPPLFAAIAGWLISKMKNAKFVLNVSDLWTDSAVDLGMLKNSVLVAIALRGEKFLYQHACLITGQTQSIVNTIRLREHRTPVALITNGVDQEFFGKTEEFNAEKWRNGRRPSGRFIIGFAGLHGLFQDLETVIEAARLLRDEKGIAFVLYGDGPKKKELIRLSKEAKLQNITFFPPQPAKRMPEVFTSFDLMLVPGKNVPISRGAVPCKMLEAMAAGVPILISFEGEAGKLVHQAQCGILVAPEDPKLMSEAVRELYHDDSLCARLGQNGRQYALEHYNRQDINKTFEELLVKVFHDEHIDTLEP